MLEHLRKSDPKKNYRMFQKKRANNTEVPLSSFFEHFKDLPSSNTPIVNDTQSIQDTAYEELDRVITKDEILKCISKLKRGKGHGIDGILNEMLLEYKDVLIPFLEEMFNRVLSSGYFPTTWTVAILVPVFEKGDPSDPVNYRGISLVSNLAKLFTSIMNMRLLLWSDTYDIITDAQF
ncbi:Hypothetical predicted protein [Mytilus galloprovincialis]|uniref:Reverse transcriptase domain-containing protein n=1 Tax=Mytilus galloprovincialis TaxID=29158 RepID=A0A8B6F119_MYTGA|nr:Hypothetical predicted protein [Mytilus galloprovincialis]